MPESREDPLVHHRRGCARSRARLPRGERLARHDQQAAHLGRARHYARRRGHEDRQPRAGSEQPPLERDGGRGERACSIGSSSLFLFPACTAAPHDAPCVVGTPSEARDGSGAAPLAAARAMAARPWTGASSSFWPR
eukprot:scaffold4102_cov86-Isochrysis_galbana.AAC.1